MKIKSLLIIMSINRNCSVYREYGLDLLESTNQYQHILEMDDDGKTRYRGNPTPGHVIHMHKTRRKYFTHIEPMLLSKSNQTSKTEVLQTPSAIEVNLGQGVKR